MWREMTGRAIGTNTLGVGRALAIPYYRVCRFDAAGHVFRAAQVVASTNDEHATEQAKQFVNGNDWNFGTTAD